MRRSLRIGAGLGLALFIVTCTDRSPTGLGRHGAAAFNLAALTATAPGAPPVPIDSARIIVRRASDQSVMKDITVALAGLDSTGDTAQVLVDVPLDQDNQSVTITVTVSGLGVTWYSGTTTATLTGGATVSPGALTLAYVGPGFDADSVRIQLPGTRFVGGFQNTVGAAVYVPGGILTGVPVGYRIANSAVATLGAAALNTTTITGQVPVHDSTWIYAETPTHKRDSIRVTIVPPAQSLTAISGGGQSGGVGVTLAAPFVVRVLDMLGGPFKGLAVTWSVTTGTATLSATTTVTDDSGYASVTATPTSAGPLTVQAAAPGLTGSPLSFPVTVGGAVGLLLVSGNNQADTIGTTLAPFVVRAVDAQNAGVANAKVAWARVSGTGAVSADTTTTDGAGNTQITYTLGGTPAPEQVRATLVGSSATVLFSVTASAGAVASVTLNAVNDTIPRGDSLQYVATLKDALGNVISGTVTWSSTVPGVATVTSGGLAKGLAGGLARIVAASGGAADTADLWIRALTTIAVSPADTVITAVGDSLSLRSVALDNFGDTVPSGVVIRYLSATPTVATVGATTGKVHVVGSGNAVVLARDSVTGVQGPATLRVNQIPAALSNTKDTLVIGQTGRGQIVARALDRNGFSIPGKTVGWRSGDVNIATVDQFGVVTGVNLGLIPIVDSLVDSAGVFFDTTVVNVVLAPPSLIQWAFDSTAVGNGGNLSVALSLTASSPSPLTVLLASSDSFIAKPSVKRVVIPANVTATSVTINGLGAGRVTLVAQDSQGVYVPDTMVVTVVSTIEFREIGSFSRQQYFYVNRNETYHAQVFLSDPAPAGGLGVTFVYGRAGTSAITPSPAIIPAGQLSADVVIQGLTAAVDSVIPTSGGFVGRFSYVYVAPESLRVQQNYPYTGVVGVGQTYQPYVYFTYVMDHPLDVAVSLAPAIGTAPSLVTIPQGSTTSYFTVKANAPGTATLGVSAPGWIGTSIPLVFSTPHLVVGGTTSMVAGDPTRGSWYISTTDSLGWGHPVIDTVTVTAVSRDPTVVAVDSVVGKVRPNNSSVNVNNALRAQPAASGDSTWIVLTAPGYPADSFLVRVTAPTMTYQISYPYDGRVGIGTRFQNAAYVGIPYVRPDTVRVHLIHSRRGILGGPDTVLILPGTTYNYFTVQGDSLGQDTVSVDTTGLGYLVSGGPLIFTVDPLRVSPYSYPTGLYTISPPQLVSATVVDSANGFARPLLAPLTVSLASGNPLAYTLDSATVTIPAGSAYSNYDTLRVVGVDTIGSRIVASAPGAYSDSSFYPITVRPTPLGIGLGYPYAVGVGLKLPFNYVYVSGGNAPDTIHVALQHLVPGIDSLSADTVLILKGQSTSQYFTIIGRDSTAIDTIVATAPGYVSSRITIQPTPVRLDVSDPGANHLTTDPSFRLRTYTEMRNGYGLKPVAPVPYTIVSSDPNVIRIDSAPGGAVNPTRDTATAVVDTALAYDDIWISFVGSGTAKLYVSTPGFDPDSSAPTTVSGPSLNLAYPTITLGKGQLFPSQYVYVNNPTTKPDTVHLLRSDSSLVPSGTQAFNLSVDSVLINTGQSSSPFFDVIGNEIGSAQLVARATGYSQAQSTIQVGVPRLSATTSMNLFVGQRPPNLGVNTVDQNGNGRIVAAATVIAATSTDSTVAKSDSATRTIAARASSTSFPIRPLKKGSVSLVLSSAGYQPDTTVVSVDTAKLLLNNPPNGLGAGQVASNVMYVTTPYTTDSSLVVTLSSTNPAVLTVPTSVTISAGGSLAYFDVTGVGVGTASVIATAPHSHPDTQAVVIATPQLTFALGTGLNAGQRYGYTIYARDSLNAIRTVTAPLTITLGSSSPSHTAFDSVSLTTTIAAGQSSVSMGVTFDTAGTYIITASASGYKPAADTMTVTGALVRMVSQVTGFVPANITIQAGQVVTWRNDDPTTPHTTTEDSATPLWNSGSRSLGQTYQRTFSTPGTFTYHCTIHPGMTGTVTVN